VHVLSALLLALGYPYQTCLQEAGALALEGIAAPVWIDLDGAEIVVFDDSPAGLGSAISAQACLEAAGVSLSMELFGIAGDSQKVAALGSMGAKTCPDINTALDLIALDTG
jgi:beta-phosphoglucomutase-like phosphatase (HAD superfamily)